MHHGTCVKAQQKAKRTGTDNMDKMNMAFVGSFTCIHVAHNAFVTLVTTIPYLLVLLSRVFRNFKQRQMAVDDAARQALWMHFNEAEFSLTEP